MFKYTHHIFVCVNQRPAGHPKGDCAGKGSRALFQKFQEETEKRQLWETVAVSGTTCLGPCAVGANVVIYPEGVWYAKVRPEDVEEILDQHVVGGAPVKRLLLEAAMGGAE